MREMYQGVSLTVDEERWAPYVWHNVYIPEPVIDYVLKEVSSLFSDDVSDRHEWAHE